MAFQAGAFQGDAFQIPAQARSSGGYGWDAPKKRRMEERVESLPEVVREAIVKVVEIDNKAEREAALLGKVDAENKFLRLYLAILEQYRIEILEGLELERLKRQEADDLALILLLSC